MDITSMLMGWVEKFGVAPEAISSNNASAIQISRIYLSGADGAVQSLKRHNKTWDNLLGLPRSKRDVSNLHESCLLPRTSYTAVFSSILQDLSEKGVNVQLGTPITIKRQNQNKPLLAMRGKNISYEKLIWACNPVPLLLAMGLGRLDNPFGKANVIFMECKNEVQFPAPFYVQVFSPDIPIFRIYVYVMGGRYLATVESFESLDNNVQAAQYVNKILGRFDLKTNFSAVDCVKQKRHIFYTPRDLARFIKFDQHPNVKSGEIINAGWAEYARDKKVARMFNSIDPKTYPYEECVV